MLAAHAGGRRQIDIQAATVREALAAARDALPGLRSLLDDEGGARRPHVRIFYNADDEESIEDLERPTRENDEIMIIQAVSGG